MAENKKVGKCIRAVVRTSDGRTFDLGPPDSIFFPLRLAFYKWRRRKELNNG